MNDWLRRHRVSTNKLLVYWAIFVAPIGVTMALLKISGPALLVMGGGWVALRMLNRHAWKLHFKPRPR